MYLILEGIDTCGKSTQIEILKTVYKDAIFTKEPFNQTIRDLVINSKWSSKEAELFLFLADRAEHFKNIIEPNRDKLIISDRGFISGIAYATDFDIDFLINLNMFALKNTKADKVIIFKHNRDLLTKRLGNKGNDIIELRGVDYLLSVQDRMFEVAKRVNLNYLEIDSNLEIDSIKEKIVNYIEPK